MASKKCSSSTTKMILDFWKGAGTQPASKPGFAHALGLSYKTLDHQALQWNESTKTLTYPMSTLSSTSHCMAVMDELTTAACFGAGRPSPPGVSLQMKLEMLAHPSYPTKGQPASAEFAKIDVVSSVVKLGKKVSFCRCEFFQNETMIAHSSHVKFMPTGNAVLDYVFRNEWAWNMYAWWSDKQQNAKKESVVYEEIPLQNVLTDTLEHHGAGRASFTVNSWHVNPFGGLHGGCHAMLMEIVGKGLAEKQLMTGKNNASDTTVLNLESIDLDFHSVGRGVVEIQAMPIGTPLTTTANDSTTLHMRVSITNSQGRLVSEGRLRWVVKKTTTTQQQQAKL